MQQQHVERELARLFGFKVPYREPISKRMSNAFTPPRDRCLVRN